MLCQRRGAYEWVFVCAKRKSEDHTLLEGWIKSFKYFMVSSLSSSRPDYFHQDKEENSESAVRERMIWVLCVFYLWVSENLICVKKSQCKMFLLFVLRTIVNSAKTLISFSWMVMRKVLCAFVRKLTAIRDVEISLNEAQ